MFNIFNSHVLIEIGEAIGNVKRKVVKEKSYGEAVEQAFRRHLAQGRGLDLRPADCQFSRPQDAAIDVEFRVIEEESNG